MKRLLQFSLLLASLLTLPAAEPEKASTSFNAVDPEGIALLQQAFKAISAYHAGQPKSDAVLRVVYFHPSDRDPLPDYAARLDRVLTDVNNFYREGLARFGIKNDGLPLERENGRLLLRVVQGRHPAKAYNYGSGQETALEIQEALKGRFDLNREHVLVIYALCRKESDGRYVFDAPYYGRGTQRDGLCHAADCELLDPQLLADVKTKMVFTEHYYPRVQTTVAEFNSMYLGGTAHELGHALGLFHDAGMNSELAFGTSLMGSGNLRYRNDVHGGQAPAILARTSALHLLSHPFFTGSNRGRWDPISGGLEGVEFATEPGRLKITGRIASAIPPYAVVAYVWRQSETDHSSRTFPVLTTNGSFQVSLDGLRPDSYFMRLTSLHVNGAAKWEDYHFGFDADGKAVIPRRFHWPWIVAYAGEAVMREDPKAGDVLTEERIDAAPVEDQAYLRVLQEIIHPKPKLKLSQISGDTASLSDTSWKKASVGWGKIARNHYWFDKQIQNGVFLMLGGQFFDKGLYAHAPSSFAYELDGKWKTFTATIGLRDGAPGQGSAIFRVKGDGKELYRSPVLRVGERAKVHVSVATVKKLELLTEGGEGHNHGAWSIWAEPALQR